MRDRFVQSMGIADYTYDFCVEVPVAGVFPKRGNHPYKIHLSEQPDQQHRTGLQRGFT